MTIFSIADQSANKSQDWNSLFFTQKFCFPADKFLLLGA